MWIERFCYWLDDLPQQVKKVTSSLMSDLVTLWKWIKRLPAQRPERKPLPFSVRKLLSDLGYAVTVTLLIFFVCGVWWCCFCLPFA